MRLKPGSEGFRMWPLPRTGGGGGGAFFLLAALVALAAGGTVLLGGGIVCDRPVWFGKAVTLHQHMTVK